MKPSIDNIRTIANPIHLNDWEIRLTSLPQAVNADISADDFNLRAVSATVPKLTVDPIEINVRGHTVRVPGDGTVNSPISVTMVENVDQKVLNMIHAWITAAFDVTQGTGAAPEDLKTEFIITLLDRQGTPLRRWILKGAWLGDADAVTELSGDKGADIVRPTLQIHFDSFEEVQL